MVCEVKVNSIKYLEKQKATNDVRRIIDTAKFSELNESLTKLAVDKYGLQTNGELLFQDTEIKLKDDRTSTYRRDSIVTINRAEPNEPLFEKLQELKVRYDQRQAIADNAIVPGQQAMFMKTPEVDYSMKVVTALMNLASPKETKRTRKYGEQTEPERLTIRLNTKAKPYLEDNIRKTLNNKGVTNQQVDFVFDYMKSNNIQEISTSDLAAAIAANYSYTIEINTAKTINSYREYEESSEEETFIYNNVYYSIGASPTEELYFKGNEEITKEEYFDTFKEAKKSNQAIPTQYYSDLTVPGGTNYTEQEIATLAITPTIKGHAQFATDKGIGWFRSDDEWAFRIAEEDVYEDILGQREYYFRKGDKIHTGKPSKTRRILEVQSDLFQKGRDREDLAGSTFETTKYGEVIETRPINLVSKNQFLQLLNKDNNWVTFFIKSIIQDSAKKGYEKVLFPSGNTASKVEGHSTLEEFKKQKEDRIKELESNAKISYKAENENGYLGLYDSEEVIKSIYPNAKITRVVIDSNIENEINQLKQELKRVNTEGLAALKPIYNFYENTVTNILKKQGYTPKQVTDEFGNTWNEVEIKPERDTQRIAFIRMDQNNNIPIVPIDLNIINQQQSKAVAEAIASKLAAKLGINYHNLSPEQATEMLKNNPVPYRGEPAFFYNGAVFIVGDNVRPGILLHEFSHPLLQGIRKTNPQLFNNLYNQLSKTDEGLSIMVYVKKAYPELDVNSDLFKEEVLAFAMQLKSMNKLENKVETEGFQSFIDKLLASLKQLLREIFGNGVNLKNLNESTSLDELAEMLLDDTMFDFGEVNLTEDDLVMYVRDIFTEADKLSSSASANVLQEIVNEFYASNLQIVNQIKDFKSDKVTREMLEKALKKQNTTNLLPGVNEILKGYQNINNLNAILNEDLEDLEKTKQMAAALINSVDRINTSSNNIIKELNNINKQPSLINNRNTIALLGLYKNTSKSWLNVIEQINELLDETEIDTNSEFYSLITSIVNNSTVINSKIAQIYKKGGVQFFVEITGYMNEFVNKELKSNLGIALKKAFSESELETAVDDLYRKVVEQKFTPEDAKALYDKGVPANILDEFIKKYNNYIVNEDKIKDALTGHAKDVSWFNRWLESYSSSNDVIVGPLSMFIQNQKTEVETKVWRMSQDFRAQLEVLLPQVNFSKMNPTQIRDMVAEKDQIFYFNKKTGEYESRDVFTFLNEFGNGWRFELDKLEFLYEEAKKSGEKDKIAKALDELRQFNKDYMWQEYTLEYYEKDDIFKDSEIGALAFSARRTALENYINLQNSLQKEYERFEKHSELQEAFKTYQRLYSLQNEDGTEKVDDPAKGIYDKSIAELLIKHRQETNKFYEWVPITNSLDTAYNEFVSELLTKDVKKGTKEYDKLLREWQKQNVRIVYSQEYYDERTRLFERLNAIQSQINEQLKTDYNVSDEYKKILDLLYTFKDDFGQPDATQLGEERLRKIKDIQQNIIDVRQKLDKYTGLSREDSATLQELIIKSRDEELTNEEAEELDRLLTAKKDVDVTLVEALSEVIGELSDISSKYPTDYYMDALETHMSKYDNIPAFTDVTVDQFINSKLFQELIDPESDLYDADLFDWFDLSHVKLQVYEDGVLVPKYQRTAANSYSKPTNPKHFINTKIKDNLTGEVISLIGVPNIRHSRREVKNEYRTIPRGAVRKDYVGKVIDNKGNFLPRSFDPSSKNSAKDGKYISEKFKKIKSNPSSPEYKLLELMKNYHLQLQDGASSYGKLYLDLPRYGIERGDYYQVLQKGEYGERFKEVRANVKEWLKQTFGKSVQDNLDQFNYNPENNLVNTDLQGNEISYIPVTGIYNLDAKNVDADVFNSLFKYGLSVQTQSALIKSLPLVNSIMETLEDPANQPKKLDSFSKGIYNLRKKQQHPTRSNAMNNRSGQVRSLIEREYHGRQAVGIEENHPVLSKWLTALTSRSSRAALALNIPSDIKNQVSGYIQTIIEASGNRYISGRDLALSATWTTKAMLEWTTKGIYEIGPGAVSTQLVQVFDPNFKATDENGKPVYRSLYKDLINGEWMYMHRKFGEMEVAMRLFGSFLYAEKIEQNYSDGSKSLINYSDAWEKDDNGILKLKEGIHPGWNYESIFHVFNKGEKLADIAKKYNVTVEELKAKNSIKSEIQLEDGQEIVIAKSEYFKQFKNKLQGTSRALFGVYDKFGQPEGNKYIMYRMFFFMRKWFTPMFANRFGMDVSKENFGGARYDWAMGRTTKGFYVEAFQALTKILKSKGADYQYLNDEQKGAMKKAATEGLIVIASGLLASMLFGFDDDDPDKWKKIKAKSGALFTDEFNTYGYISNHALLLLLGVQAETGAFIPLPSIQGFNFGADDYAKMLTSTTTAFGNTLLTYIEIFGDVLNLITLNDDAVRYKKDVGPYWWQKKGELKTYKRLFTMLGLTGGIGDPETSLKNLSKGATRIR
jgi:LysM repeat protein